MASVIQNILSLTLYLVAFNVPVGAFLLGSVCYVLLIPLCVSIAIFVLTEIGLNETIFFDALSTLFSFLTLSSSVLLLNIFYLSYVGENSCEALFFNYCANNSSVTLERVILYLINFVFVLFSTIQIIVRTTKTAAFSYLLCCFVVKLILTLQFASVSNNKWTFWSFSVIVTLGEMLVYILAQNQNAKRETLNKTLWMIASILDTVGVLLVFYNQVQWKNFFFWFIGFILLSRGLADTKTVNAGLSAVQIVASVAVLIAQQELHFQNKWIEIYVKTVALLQAGTKMSLYAGAQQILSGKKNKTVAVLSVALISIVSVFVLVIFIPVTETINTNFIYLLNLFLAYAIVDVVMVLSSQEDQKKGS